VSRPVDRSRKGAKELIKSLWSYRDLLLSLARRNYQLRYRQSVAGYVWAIVPPLLSVGVATLVFDKVAHVDTGDVPYPLFAFAALAPWTFFMNCITYASGSVVQAQGMISRIPFPKAVLPLAMSGTVLIDLGFASLTFVVYAYVTGAGLPLTALWAPLLLLLEIVLTIGIVLLVSAVNVFVRDVRLAVPFLVQALLFLTPVMYALNSVPASARPWYRLNPMAGLMESFRDVLIAGVPPQLDLLIPAIVGSIAVLIVGGWYFSAIESRFADVV
jgi:lipopolysaccharide transport system permease protein